MDWLLNITQAWSGPISVSVFTPDLEYEVSVQYIYFLQTCYPGIKEQVSFHFVYPLSHPMRSMDWSQVLHSDVSCDQDPKDYLSHLLSFQVSQALHIH